MSTTPVRFLFRGDEVSLDLAKSGISPTTTVLRYLRENLLSPGTKEGCAEGDCGACTVVLAEPEGTGRLRYKAIDSCLVFLPMLHGKQLLTVEDIGTPERLHPVQQAMAECNGTQCGFCTPGFVMSLVALSKGNGPNDRLDIEDALTGNLCRCTGYRPILDAAESCLSSKVTDRLDVEQGKVIEKLLLIDKTAALDIEVNGQRYVRPAGLDSALSALAGNHDLMPFSGATDLALRVTKKHEKLSALLDLSAVAELRVLQRENDRLVIGAGVTLEELRHVSKSDFPSLHSMLNVFGSRQIRTLATIGGNLGSASPIGDLLPVLLALEAVIELGSTTGIRSVPMHEFITGYRSTVRRKDELIIRILLPLAKSDSVIRSYKVSKRQDMDISTVSGGFSLKLNSGIIDSAILAFGGMAAKTERAAPAEDFLKGKKWDRKTAEETASLVRGHFHPISDARAGAAFRSVAAGNLILKFWNETGA
jgi:xanthine dehydrogenase small subunit